MDKYISGRDLLVTLRSMVWVLSEEHPNTWIDDYSGILYEISECTHAVLHMWDTYLNWGGNQLTISDDYHGAMLGRSTLIIDYIRQLPEGGIATHGITKESLKEITEDIAEHIKSIHAES